MNPNPVTQDMAPAARADPWAHDGSQDPDSCRICRGEATADEPLFYPCKCSGSIKFVHQDCLMEWLSHSQKKHCELCKTPFRFTKLYSPNMPKRLPFHVFLQHMTAYLFQNLLVWLRAGLVTTVWLVCLPWLMRWVWSLLFWISDEGFSATTAASLLDARNASSALRTSSTMSLNLTGTTTCPSTPLLAQATSTAVIGGLVDQFPVSAILKAVTKPFNFTTKHTWLNMFLGLPAHTHASSQDFLNNVNLTVLEKWSNATDHSHLPHRHASLLSDVSFLKHITRNPFVNRTIVAILEGQVITLLVIICFILIILVRDYVVQQQPEINMRAAFAAVENAENDMAPVAVPINVPAPAPDHPANAEDPVDEDELRQVREEIARWDAQHQREPRDPPGPFQIHNEMYGPGNGDTFATPQEFNHIDGIPDDGSEDGSQGLPFRSEDSYLDRGERRRETSPNSSVMANKADSDGSSWTWADSEDGHDTLFTARHNARLNKGKGRADEIFDQDVPSSSSSQSSFPAPTPLRPRAVSDGPQLHDAINPLANNSWSFSHLPPDLGVPSEGGNLLDLNREPLSQPTLPSPSYQEEVFGDQEVRETQSASSSSANAAGPRDSSPSRPIPTLPTLFQPTPTDNTRAQILDDSDQQEPQIGTGTEPPTRRVAFNPEVQNIEHMAAEPPIRRMTFDPEVQHIEPIEHPGPESEPEVHPIAVPVQPPNSIVDRVADFMWGDVQPADADALNQEEPVDIFGDNQNVPFMHGGREEEEAADDDQNELEAAPDVVEAAVAAGLDPEAIDDAEDFDGIMELIGMRGPIAGLFQNAVFCAFLVSISIFFGIFVPYNIGRVAVWVLANPARLLRIVFSFARFVQDAALLAVGYTCTFFFNIVEVIRIIFNIEHGKQAMRTLRVDARQLGVDALDRMTTSFVSDIPVLSANEMRNFSAISHHALIVLKANIRYCVISLGDLLVYLFGGDFASKLTAAQDFWAIAIPAAINLLKDIPNVLLQPNSWAFNFTLPKVVSTVDPSLAYWDVNDRTWAILVGYSTITLLAALYLSRGTPFSSSQAAQEWEASIIDGLNQASGVMKVILIISIEMLVFPLYCGLLLDFALLPLFESTSFKSRLLFTYNYPLTSIFVHWFVGTGYMFHFALFVSMCRKIMRKGVLYFIRDPDDPEFHPVRDVLERNVTTQLRKILFSAFVYGALVVVCLGGVVWGLSLTIPNVLPIHYSSNEPVLEFPIDLLFYNFLMPLAVKVFKPSDGLHAMYTWWFRRCASGLRLTWFLFGERCIDEEGNLAVPESSRHYLRPWWRKVFLEVNPENEAAPKTWSNFFEGGRAKPTSKIDQDHMKAMNRQKRELVTSGQLITDGRFVRSPASDQVKIPKGQAVFYDIDEESVGKVGGQGPPESSIYASDNYQVVYIPPWFRTRIFLFILSIWIFAAATGVSFTIIPLVFGRHIFKALIPSHIRTNDIYAFSIGIYVLGSASYLVFHLGSAFAQLQAWTGSTINSLLDRHAFRRAIHLTQRAWKLVYTYTMLLVVFPILSTVLVEIYVLVPVHTYMYPTQTALRFRDGHTIRVIQAWTLGILYLKLGSRGLTLCGGRPAQAVRAVLRRGWLEPDVGVLTRAFVIPGFIASAAMIFTPPIIAWAVLNRCIDKSTEVSYEMQVFAYRLAYPLTASFWVGIYAARKLLRIFEGWQVRIRDEAYLMGERLHNFTGTARASVWGRTTRI
ncbi:hypothetical protein F5Y16DRAFT_389330 [Xylariaceae sp. FL0255]|nr:hypothetical protein F5Y16DRAFT_389330 [Xylariaceae sp. FL0255]